MYIVHVSIQVKEEHLDSFKKVTAENASNSLQEPGIIRFDVLQNLDDPCQFLFIEIYNSPKDQLKHRETEHFKKWRNAVTSMLKEPYIINKYNNVFS